MRQLPRTLRQLLRLDHAMAGGAPDEARMLEQGAVEAQQSGEAADLVLVERPEHAPASVLAVDAVDDQLRHERVVEPGDLGAGRDPGVDAHARTGRLAVARDPPGGRQEAV